MKTYKSKNIVIKIPKNKNKECRLHVVDDYRYDCNLPLYWHELCTIEDLMRQARHDESVMKLPRTDSLEGRLPLLPQISKNAVYERIEPENGIWQNYFRVSLNDWLDLSLVIDVLDAENKLVVDWKASTKRSTEHNKMQIYLYALAMSKLPQPIKIERGIYGTIKQAQNEAVYCSDYSIFKINNEKIELALNYAETLAGEIKDFLDNRPNNK